MSPVSSLTFYKYVLGYDNHIKETTFTVGLQNISSTDVNMIVEKIENTFDQVARGGSNERFGIILFFGEGGGHKLIWKN